MVDSIELTVNGLSKTIRTDPQRPLLQVLREDLGMLGTKYACGEGQCGACTVLVDGRPTRSCVTEVGKLDGKRILTIEGLAKDGELHRLQEAFLEEGAVQCGYCTSGMILSAVALLENNASPSQTEIIEWMDSNICRCNGYHKILNSIRKAASESP